MLAMQRGLIICLIITLLIPHTTTITSTCGGPCICDPVYITCGGATITDIPTAVTGATLSTLLQFICSSCNIQVLKANSFAAYPLLNSITIQYSGLIDIEEGAFDDIATQLTYLDLSNNALTVIKPTYFASLTLVGFLDIQTNSITQLQPGSFNDLTSLTTITLQSNLIKNLPDFIFSSTQVSQFDISHNELYVITDRPFPNISFNTFYASSNNIARIHPNLTEVFDGAGRILLDDNPLICDCYLTDLQFQIQSNPARYNDAATPPKCGYPPSLLDQSVSSASIPSVGCYDVCLNIGCDTSATCSDVDEWPQCTCGFGFFGNGYICEDFCTDFGCQGNSICTHDSVSMDTTCVCPIGYELDNTTKDCIQINECLTEDSCPLNSTCVDSPGSFSCNCFEGFVLNTDPILSCDDVNECDSVNDCSLNTTCHNEIGTYRCECILGYEENSPGYCADTDECLVTSVCPPNTSCSNQPGDFICECQLGFVEVMTDICEDIDECSDVTTCQINSHCSNTIGSFFCECNPGYEESGVECMDINECLNVSLFNCPPDSTCQNLLGNYTCGCDPGYENVSSVCMDIDECLNVSLFNCPPDSTCQNQLGSYRCGCDPGYEEIGMECMDINECLNVSLFNCPPDSTCQNLLGNYTCGCDPGYENVSSVCMDIDECLNVSLFNCPPDSTCQNQLGSYRCGCDPGYEEIGMECMDINECLNVSLFNCPPDSTCQNFLGSYKCDCDPGYENVSSVCMDINECSNVSLLNCPPDSTCQNFLGSYKCDCDPGYENVSSECMDINECLNVSLFNCPPDSTCQNQLGSYRCGCDPGYENVSSVCMDIDECSNVSLFNCPPDSTCQNQLGSYRCGCDPGYENVSLVCVDIDECLNVSLSNCPPDSTCQNQLGSYRCGCDPGYENVSSVCMDIDECSNVSLFNCPPDSTCQNQLGSYRCGCDPGYENVSLVCVDIDECLNVSLSNCPPDSTCQNQLGSYRCGCDPGYENVSSVCMDIDECSNVSLSNCPPVSTCQNQLGSYRCGCDPGYENVSSVCMDIDECSNVSLSNCPPDSTCQNQLGSYRCGCDAGYENVSSVCMDIDECSNVSLFNCPPDSTCQNLLGNYTCGCDPGYEESGLECLDINECLNIICHNATCQNTIGNYTCQCNTGFVKISPHICEDLNECSDMNLCVSNSTCNNTLGSYFCECFYGYEEVAEECIDINECSDLDSCPLNSNCVNSLGGYDCHCHTGYEEVLELCLDKDECLNGEATCHVNSHCINQQGSYRCECDTGFEVVEGNCVDINECELGHNCGSGENCTNLPGNYTCVLCPSGHNFVNDTCVDINECDLFTNLCLNGGVISGTCVNTNTSYFCDCLDGFESSNTECVDLDECIVSPNICHFTSTCVNNIGAYSCTCPDPGYIYTGELTGCSDINECDIPTSCSNSEVCANSIGTYTCMCLDGFYRDISGLCADSDECIGQNDQCDRLSTDCINTYGGYACSCKVGFTDTSNILLCNDVDECLISLCGVTADCVNSIGSYSCNCDTGYQLDGAKECIDTNECGLNICPDNSQCYNELGTHACVCKEGFYTVQSGGVNVCSNFLPSPFCPSSTQSGFSWPAASANTTTTIVCPNNPDRFAKRFCNQSAVWNLPEISNCVSEEIAQLTDQLSALSPLDPNFTAELSSISQQLNTALTSDNLLASDYLQTVQLFQSLTEISENYILLQMSFIPQTLAEEMFQIASTIVNTDVLEEINQFDPTTVLTAITDILGATESLTQNLVYTLFSGNNSESSITIRTDNILVYIQKIETEDGFVVSFNTSSGDTIIDIPYDSIKGANFRALDDTLKNASLENCETAASFFNIQNIQAFLTQNQILNFIRFESWYCGTIEEEEAGGLLVNSDHVSAAITAARCSVDTDKLKNGIIVTFKHTDVLLINAQCVYTSNYSVAQTGDLLWDTITCTKLPTSNNTHTMCNCTHLTSFAILMSPDPYYSSGTGMSVFSYFSLSISILFLLISLALHFMKLSITGAVLFVHRNLIFTILLSQIVFVLGIERNEVETLCLIIAAFLHYILLVSFVWMLIEAINALILIKRPFINQFWLKIIYACFAYLSPLIIVAVTLGVSICDYGHYPLANGGVAQVSTSNCWLPRRNGRYWAFIGPALIIIAVNCILLFGILILILRLQFKRKQIRASSMKSSQTETLVKGLASAVRATVLMVPILGITWIFGVFALNSINVVVSQVSQWLFLVFNCYQGVFIFIFFCLLNQEVRAEFQVLVLRKVFRKWTDREDLKEYGFFLIARGGGTHSRTPIINRKSSQLSNERNFKNIRLNILNVSTDTFGSENREILSNNFKY